MHAVVIMWSNNISCWYHKLYARGVVIREANDTLRQLEADEAIIIGHCSNQVGVALSEGSAATQLSEGRYAPHRH